jgi:TRAP-type C4-dicarboxylate transport system substrate-binding protein
MVDLPLTYVVGEIVVDKKVIDTLSAEDRKALDESFAAGFVRLDKINRGDNASAREALKQQGISFTVPDDAERKRWEAVGSDAFKELIAQGGISPTMLKALNDALAEIRGGTK